MAAADSQANVIEMLPKQAPEAKPETAEEVYALHLQYFIDLENEAGDIEVVMNWCRLVASCNYAFRKMMEAREKEDKQEFKNGAVREYDYWENKFRRATEGFLKCSQALGAAQAYRRRMKQEKNRTGAKGKNDNFPNLDDPDFIRNYWTQGSQGA
jgi:hypothetical protein